MLDFNKLAWAEWLIHGVMWTLIIAIVVGSAFTGRALAVAFDINPWAGVFLGLIFIAPIPLSLLGGLALIVAERLNR